MARRPLQTNPLPVKGEPEEMVLVSIRIPRSMKEQLERVANASKRSQQDILVIGLAAELDVRETLLAERVAALQKVADLDRREQQLRERSQSQRARLSHATSGTHENPKSAKRTLNKP
jgi:predicted transcriptional regulator